MKWGVLSTFDLCFHGENTSSWCFNPDLGSKSACSVLAGNIWNNFDVRVLIGISISITKANNKTVTNNNYNDHS